MHELYWEFSCERRQSPLQPIAIVQLIPTTVAYHWQFTPTYASGQGEPGSLESTSLSQSRSHHQSKEFTRIVLVNVKHAISDQSCMSMDDVGDDLSMYLGKSQTGMAMGVKWKCRLCHNQS